MIERKIICHMLHSSTRVADVYRFIEPQALYDAVLPKYKDMIDYIYRFYTRYKNPPTYNLLREEFDGDLDICMEIDDIEEEDVSPHEVGYNIDLIRSRYTKFLSKNLSKDLTTLSSYDDVSASIKRALTKISATNKNSTYAEGDFAESADERLNKYKYISENPEDISGMFTGYRELDEYTWGIKNAEMMVISGASSSGKSLLMTNIAINAWLGSNDPLKWNGHSGDLKDDGKNIIYFTLEMSKSQVEDRMDAKLASIRHTNLTRGQLDNDELNRLKKSLKFQKEYSNLKKFYVVDLPRGSKPMDIESKFDAALGILEPDAIFVDYLNIMSPNIAQNVDWMNSGDISEQLAEICKDKNIPLITASQRKARNRNGKESYDDAEDLGRSKRILDNSNIIIQIANRKEERLREDMEIYITKNRDGKKGKFSLLKEFHRSTISSVPDDWAVDVGEENRV